MIPQRATSAGAGPGFPGRDAALVLCSYRSRELPLAAAGSLSGLQTLCVQAALPWK